MSDVSFENNAWKYAVKCALRRSRALCSGNFYTAYCENCTYFVKNYLPAEVDEQAVNHIMHKAEEKAWAITMGKQNYLGFAASFLICILFAWIVWDYDPFWIRTKTKTTTPPPVTRGLIADTGVEQHANIDETLGKVAEELWKGRDVNGDKLLNCIDATVIFYHYFPDKSKVCIMSNDNPSTHFNHLFIGVFSDGTWKLIEPQAYYFRNESYLMEDVWDGRYDMRYNEEETRLWRWYLPWRIGSLDFTSRSFLN